MLQLDHLAIVAPTLQEGCDWLERQLGAALGPEGKHVDFGTHNRLMGLSGGLYLEVIAVDPNAAPPGRARWFDLDRMAGPPRIGNWICRTDDLEGAEAALPGMGAQVALERGPFRWRMVVPPDGQLPFDGCHPAVIQWDCATHPADALVQAPITLRRMVVSHPEAQELEARVAPRLPDRRVVFETGAAGLRAEFDTPGGCRFIG